MRLRDKVAIVTGGSSGIGRAIAIAFAREGARVVIADVREESRSGDITTVQQIKKMGGEAIFVRTNVSRMEDVDRVVRKAVNEFGRLDIMVNNAGISIKGGVDEISEVEWDRLIDVNLKGVFLCSKRAVREMLKQGTGGKIINIASIAGVVSCSRYSAYCASKAAIIGLTRQMAMDYGSMGITVNAISPGIVEPGMIDLKYNGKTGTFVQVSAVYDERFASELKKKTPIPKFGKPEDVAHCAVFLASPESDFVNGHNLVVDGGFTAGWWTERRS